jgi:hypothetical protein
VHCVNWFEVRLAGVQEREDTETFEEAFSVNETLLLTPPAVPVTSTVCEVVKALTVAVNDALVAP